MEVRIRVFVLFLFLLMVSGNLFATEAPRPAESPLAIAGHAHNDYEHEYPLWDALSNGFISIEADIHLVEDDFLVAHDIEDVTPGRTLSSLYLDPLEELVRRNSGSVYPDGSSIILMVDMKSSGEELWPALRSFLMEYREMLTFFREGKVYAGPVTVIVSGNRDWESMSRDDNCPALYDGRIEDMDENPKTALIPVISAGWGDLFNWEGKGEVPESDIALIRRLVAKAHMQGRKVRFWATDVPDPSVQEYAWDLLLECGVDLINTDRLEQFRRYVSEKANENPDK